MRQTLTNDHQVLTEGLEAKYKRKMRSATVECRLDMRGPIHYCVVGEGPTVQDAKDDAVIQLAAAIVDDVEREEAPIREETLDRVRKALRRRGRHLRAVA